MELTHPDMNTELVVVMSSLGFYDGDTYFKGTDCVESLKDLIRFLRREDETCNIRRQIGYSRVLQKDLLPMLMCHGDDMEIVDIVMRLLVNLTSPLDICFNKKPDEAEEAIGKQKVSNTYQTKYLEVIGYLQAYKEAFTEQKVLAAIGAQLGKILQMDWVDRGEDELLLFERILLLIRNILHVPSSQEEEKRTDDDVSLHDQVLWNMHLNGIDDLMIYITSSPDETRWLMHAVEIVQLMLREQNPEKLARASEERSVVEKAEDTKALLSAKEKENLHRTSSAKKRGTTRHSRFGGTFWVMNMKGVGNKNTLVQHQHVADVDDICFDHKKYKNRVPKRKQAAKETSLERRSTLNIRMFLKDFCNKFLEHSYNTLMKIVKDNLAAKRSQENDDTYYLWCLRFFMAFNRCHSFKVEYVSETMNMNAFHYILRQINMYYDNFFMYKRGGWEPWQKRLHLAVAAYKELLIYISFMDKAQDHILKDAASVMKNNVFYHEEYRSVFLMLLRHYDSSKQTKKYLTDLVECFHAFLKLLEMFCKGKETLLIKTKKRTAKKRKTKNPVAVVTWTAEQLEDIWENEVAPNLSEITQGHEALPQDVPSPFDVMSDVPVDEQRINAMVRIQDHLRAQRCADGVALLRISRECWPDEEKFGSDNISPENEFMILRSLLFEEFDRSAFVADDAEQPYEENEEMEEEEEEASSVRNVEREFHLQQFLTSLASPQVMIPYAILLKSFKTNSYTTNRAIIKAMHRVAVDLKFPEMFFQLSLFMCFKEILDIEASEYKELVTFAKYILSKFTKMASDKPDIYVEVLFWKGTGDCYQMSERDDERKTKSSEIHREKWSFEEEEELRTLYDTYKESEDIVGDILKNITNTDRTRRQITNKLVRLHLVENTKQLPKPRKQRPSEWREEQTEELHRLFEEFRNTHDPVGNIMNALSFNKSKKAVKDQLISTGKVSDRKELHKKRRRKRDEFKELLNKENEINTSSDSSGDDTREKEPHQVHHHDSHSSDSEDEFDRFTKIQREEIKTQAGIEDDDSNVQSSAGEIVKNLRESGFTQQIIWLQTRLKRAADGREEDSDWYPVPLLTITEEDENALENSTFRMLLKSMGLKPPADHQESFWRIPESLSPQQLRNYAHKLDLTAVRNETINNPHKTPVNETRDERGTMKSDMAIKKKRLRRSYQLLHSDSDSEDDDKLFIDQQTPVKSKQTSLDDSDKENNTVNKLNTSKKKNLTIFDSDDNDSSEEVLSKVKGKRTNRSLNLSDSDDDDDVVTSKSVGDEKDGAALKGKKRSLSLSDSDENGTEVSKTKKVKTRRVLDEDTSDEEDTQAINDGISLHSLLGRTQSLAADKMTSSNKLEKRTLDGGPISRNDNLGDEEVMEHEQSALNFSLRISEDDD